MDIPDMNDVTNNAKKIADIQKLADTDIGKELVNKIADVGHSKVAEIRKIATDKGLGSAFDKILDIAEEKTGLDIDGDGDTGK